MGRFVGEEILWVKRRKLVPGYNLAHWKKIGEGGLDKAGATPRDFFFLSNTSRLSIAIEVSGYCFISLLFVRLA